MPEKMPSEELSTFLFRLQRPASSLPSLAQLSDSELARLASAVESSCVRHDHLIHSALTRTLPRSVSRFLLQRLRRSAS